MTMSTREDREIRVSFDAHVALLRTFLARRREIVERVQTLLNAQRKAAQYLEDTPLLARLFGECFFALPGISAAEATLERELDEAHWASGFKPRQNPGQHNDIVDPAELAGRAFLMWERTRWPGRDARVRYAETLFDLYVLRRLILLAMRIWDDGTQAPGERLAQVQAVLDELWRTGPADRPVFVRDAHWLFGLAQSPTTDELHGYFDVARQIDETLPYGDRLEISSASVRMAGGHLRSQLRHVATQKRVPLDEPSLVLSTRRSNALDLATLIQALVPLLEAYERAAEAGEADRRLVLADAICQGISPDPELFVNRLDLLAPYSMIEYLFIAADRDGNAAYTPLGERHLALVREYEARIARAAPLLAEDCTRFRPVAGTYSPYGVLYGFSSRVLEHIGLKASQPDAVRGFTLEDVFVAGGPDKLAWVSGWRKLPHVPLDVLKLFEYPQAFAEQVFARVERALRERDSREAASNGRLVAARGDEPHAAPDSPPILPAQYVFASDAELVAQHKAVACDEPQLLHSRTEGEFLVSFATPRGWVAITKDVLTDVVGAGRDASIPGLPPEAARVLELMCPELVVVANDDAPGC